MSELDDILFNEELSGREQVEQIKTLFLELIGEDDVLDTSNGIGRRLGWDECRNQFRKELRQKVEEL